MTIHQHTAEFDYPGLLFPETRTEGIDEPTLAAALDVQPDDRWYAVTIRTAEAKRFTADDGEETVIATASPTMVGRWVVGDIVHVDDITPTDDNRILISNIRNNTDDGRAVKTRRGNWQLAADYDGVIDPTTMKVTA